MYSWMYGSNGQRLNDVIIIPDDLESSRKAEYEKIMDKHPGLIPIIIHPDNMEMSKTKYLVVPDVKFEKFASKARTYCPNLKPNQPLFFSANDVWIAKEALMSEVYAIHKRSDGFIHIKMHPEPQIYPQAGDSSPGVLLGIVPTVSG